MWKNGVSLDNADSPTDSMKKAMSVERARYDELCATLKKEQIASLDALLNASMDVLKTESECSFVRGYRTATRIMLESLK